MYVIVRQMNGCDWYFALHPDGEYFYTKSLLCAAKFGTMGEAEGYRTGIDTIGALHGQRH